MVDLNTVSTNCGLTYEKKRMLAYGNYHNYPIIVQSLTKDYMCKIVMSAKTDDAQAAALTSFLSDLAAGDKAIKFASYDNPMITVGIISKGAVAMHKKGDAKFQEVLDEVVNYCSLHQLAPCCTACGSQNNLGVYSALGVYTVMCPACFEKAKNELADAQQELHEKSTNYAAGIVGALIGALPGVALWIIIGEFGRIAAISALILILGSLFGFRKLGGKLNVGGVIFSVVIAAGMLYLAEYSSMALHLYNALKSESEISFLDAFQLVPEALKDHDVFDAFIHNLVIGYVLEIAAAISSVYHEFKQANLKYEMQKLN